MAKWKLCRQIFGNEEYEFTEGEEIRIGRGLDNTITFSSIVISRNHCLLNFKRDEVVITDLKSSNGIYVGLKKIPPNVPYILSEADLIGFGWAIGAPLVNIMDSEKYVFKLIKNVASIINRIKFQSNSELYVIEDKISNGNIQKEKPIQIYKTEKSPTSKTKLHLKRKISIDCKNTEIKKESENIKVEVDISNIISDSDSETKECMEKKIKLDPIIEDLTKQDIKIENDDLQYEAFNVKQEYLGYDDEPIQIDSDSDGESEQWLLRLSQNSPGKTFTKIDHSSKRSESNLEEGSYSQLDDVIFVDNEEDFINDLISVPNEPQENLTIIDKGAPLTKNYELPSTLTDATNEKSNDVMDGVAVENKKGEKENAIVPITPVQISSNTETKKAVMIEAPIKPSRRKSLYTTLESKSKKKIKRHNSTSSKNITNSQKEERKRKLKKIAEKHKDIEESNKKLTTNSNKSIVNVKVTTSNRGAFLSDFVKTTISPLNRSNQEKDKNILQVPELENQSGENVEITKIEAAANEVQKNKSITTIEKSSKCSNSDFKIPFRNLRPINETQDSLSGKPVSKVVPLPPKKPRKRVRFSDTEPVVHIFKIEPGNKLNKTSSIKTRLLDVRPRPLNKIILMKILRWNPQWLDEQINKVEPPPILDHNNLPMSIYHYFKNHAQYVEMFGDLLLMEIWECITQAYMRTKNQTNELQLRIDSLPIGPPQERYFELFNLNVNVSLSSSGSKHAPRVGDIMMVEYGNENDKNYRFFFVHNVRYSSSQKHSKKVNIIYLSLYTTYTEKLLILKPGTMMIGRTLTYINNELILFEAMDLLARCPLREAILSPKPHLYTPIECRDTTDMKTQWMMTLNPSQKLAVNQSVYAALGDRPSIQMVQGPPGTGKSSVICSIVMTYFYNSMSNKLQNRGKILICATSNAAVDELVIRLLNIRQSLPKEQRFRMVRVGRAEAMHARARDVSSQTLAQRDAQRAQLGPAQPGLDEEISHLEAKINMWKTTARDAKDPVRVAYCEGRAADLMDKISLLSGGGAEAQMRPEQLAQAERRIVECADIIVTTLASAHNHKMRGLKGRIALCIVDEAGQAIEPETLIPLMLDVTRLTLVGDPQQLPGFICSQRAKRHGLGESLFSRLTSCSEQWPVRPVVLLDQQYRMHPAIADYPNRAFYDGRVRSVPPPAAGLDLPPYSILAISGGDKGQESSGANAAEAWGVARVAAALAAPVRARGLALAVITPYSAQRDLLRACLRDLQGPSESPVEVNTVDSFQGQERDVVVVSLARSHGLGFLADAGRMNVMLTRARHALLVCLNPLAVVNNDQWQTLVDDAHLRRVYKMLPNKICKPARGRHISHNDILNYIK